MRMLIVNESQQIVAVGFDPLASKLRVEFRGGRTYDYLGVTPDVFAAFVSAPSMGSYHARNIKALFDFERVQPDDEPEAPPPAAA